MTPNWLILAAALMALAYMLTVVRVQGRRPLFKALPVALLALAAWLSPAGAARWWLIGALLWSAAGDIWLAVDGRRYFVHGLASFLVAHLLYAALFARALAWTTPGALFTLLLLLLAGGIGRVLWPRLGNLRLPVAAYLGAIMLMGALAAFHAPFSALLASGGVLFAVSDGLIALDRFVRPVPARDWLVMGSYYLAQGLLVVGWLLSQSAL